MPTAVKLVIQHSLYPPDIQVPDDPYWYFAEVVRWKDGDTPVLAYLDQGFNDYKAKPQDGESWRLLGLDTWETRRIRRKGRKVSKAEVIRGKMAKRFVQKMLPEDTVLLLHSVRKGKKTKVRGVYGRYLAEVFFRDSNGEWVDYAKLMIQNGFDRRRQHRHPISKGALAFLEGEIETFI